MKITWQNSDLNPGSNGCAQITLNVIHPSQAMVTGPEYAQIWYTKGGWSGVVTLQYLKTHTIVDLYPLGTYTKAVQLREAMDALTSPSTSSIHPNKQGSLSLGMQ